MVVGLFIFFGKKNENIIQKEIQGEIEVFLDFHVRLHENCTKNEEDNY